MIERLIFEGLKALAWLGENFPDHPRLGRRLLLAGIILVSSVFLPANPQDPDDPFLIVKAFFIIAGTVCLVLVTFVFFRRWVWRRQDRRAPLITSLKLK
jgi:hypothetical protein